MQACHLSLSLRDTGNGRELATCDSFDGRHAERLEGHASALNTLVASLSVATSKAVDMTLRLKHTKKMSLQDATVS